MNRNEIHNAQSPDEKHDQFIDKNEAAYFVQLAKKIGFDEREIAEMEKLYQSQLEEAKHEHRSSI